MTDDTTKRKLEAALASARVTVTLLEAELADVTQGVIGDDPLLDTKQALAEFGIGHDGIKSAIERGELAASRGGRGKILIARSELRRYLQSKPVRPRKAEPPPETISDWDRQAQGALRSIGGGKK
jgi:hypothetical protein